MLSTRGWVGRKSFDKCITSRYSPRPRPPLQPSLTRTRYEYSLRHLYGLEGKRRAYSSQSCARIASIGWGGSGAGGSGHGCPFHSHQRIPGGGGCGSGGGPNDTSVRGMLAAQNLSAVDIEDIVGPLESRGGNATAGHGAGAGVGGSSGSGGALAACQRHFSATHRWAAGGGSPWRTGGRGTQEASPNGWLAASTRSTQPQEHGQGQPQGQGQGQGQQAVVAAAAADQGEFLTQRGQGV